MRKVSLKLFGILSCLMILATLSIFGQDARINKKPLQDCADDLNQKLEKGEVDLSKPFSVTLESYLTKEGKFDIKRSRFTKSEGDRQMVEVVKQAIEAVSDSGMLSYLQQFGIEKVIVNLSQDDKNVAAVITSELPTVEKAKTIASSFNALFQMAKINVKEETEKTLLNATKASSQDKNFIINFTMPKEEAQQLLKNELQKAKEKSYSNKVN